MKTATHPNAAEIADLLDKRQLTILEIVSLKSKLAKAQARLQELGDVVAYLGGKCPNCGELGLICLDSDGFCQFC